MNAKNMVVNQGFSASQAGREVVNNKKERVF
jgi:hypothetical protein